MTEHQCIKADKLNELEKFVATHGKRLEDLEKQFISFESKILEQLRNIAEILKSTRSDHDEITRLKEKVDESIRKCDDKEKRIDELSRDNKDIKKQLSNLMMKIAGISAGVGILIQAMLSAQ